LLMDISVAIATTKVPMLLDKGFWAAAHEARTDVSMLLGLIFLAAWTHIPINRWIWGVVGGRETVPSFVSAQIERTGEGGELK